MPEAAQLPELHLEILKLVWSAWSEPNNLKVTNLVDGGLTRDEIFEALKGKTRSRWKAPKTTSGTASEISVEAPPLVNASDTLKRHLQALTTRPPNYLTSGRVTDRPGSPFVYEINDVTVITYPSTAFMMTEVFRAQKHMEASLLIKAMLQQHKIGRVAFVADQSASDDEIRVEIKEQLEWCIAQKYLVPVDEHATGYRAGKRLHYEYKLLEFIARPRPFGA
jgi:hypothetical protein